MQILRIRPGPQEWQRILLGFHDEVPDNQIFSPTAKGQWSLPMISVWTAASNVILELVRDQEIVNPPTGVALSGVTEVGPPGIGMLLIGVEVAEAGFSEMTSLMEFRMKRRD